jgi:hypothetical protein
MSIKTRMTALTLAALVATGSIAATATSAEARGFHEDHGFHENRGFHEDRGFREGRGFYHGWGFGAAADGSYSDGYYCHWVPRFDIYRNYIGRVRSCYY